MFAQARDTLEDILKRSVVDFPGVTYFKHKGFWERQVEGFKLPMEVESWSNDSIHPNALEGREKYKTSLRAAILEALKLRSSLRAQRNLSD
jgi:hypothetical protein